MTLNSKERMRTALEGGKVDRMPIAMMLDGSYLCRAADCDPREHGFSDNEGRADIQVRFRERHPHNDLIVAWYGASRDVGTKKKLKREGDRFFLQDAATGEIEELPDPSAEINSGARKTSELSVANPVTCETDIGPVLGPVLTPEDVLESGRQDILCSLSEKIGDSAFLAFRPGELFPPAIEALGGFERAMETMSTDPDLVASVVRELALRKIPFIRAGAKYKPDAAVLTAFLEGTDMISPKLWRDAVLPGHKIMTEEAKKHGMKVLFWAMGGCLEHLESLIEIGIDGLIVEQSRCAYSCDPMQIREVVGDRLCIFGWTPELAMINDDRAEISRVVEEQMLSAGAAGPFGMSTTFLTDEVAPETVDFFCDEVVRISAGL